MKKQDPIARFWKKVYKTETCWLWTAGKDKDGYGKFWLDEDTIRAHRVSWEMHNGPIPEEMDVLHSCDNPPCVRPSHLFLGDNADNMADRDRKGRNSKGDSHWSRTNPELIARGDRNGARTHPERLARGPRLHPEKCARGERIGRAVLTEEVVRQIRAARANGETQRSIANRLGIGLSAVKHVDAGRVWKHVA